MYCENCGSNVSDNTKKCPYCGAFQTEDDAHEENAFPSVDQEQDSIHSEKTSPLAEDSTSASDTSGVEVLNTPQHTTAKPAAPIPTIPSETPLPHSFCTYCGQSIPQGVSACPYCAYPVKDNTVGTGTGPSPSGRASEAFNGAKNKINPKLVGLLLVGIVAALLMILLVVPSLFAKPEEGATDKNSPTAQQSQGTPSSQSEAVNQVESKNENKIEVQSGLANYSWADLGMIAQEIEQKASSRSDALKIAASYHLVGPEGAFSGETKTLELRNGETVDIFIVDVYHDKMADGKYAAFTFMAAECYGSKYMNAKKTNAGGWKGSDMREWLNSEVYSLFPVDLQSAICPVVKQTNNVGKTTSPSDVSGSTDNLWLFSWVECLGPISWNAGYDTDFIDKIDNEEGYQYEWFSQEGVAGKQGHSSLIRCKNGTSTESVWWMRSSAPNTDTSFGDMGPEVDNGGSASTPEGVVFGFCL